MESVELNEAAMQVTKSDAFDLLALGKPAWNTYKHIQDTLFDLARDDVQLPLNCVQFLFAVPYPKMYVFYPENWMDSVANKPSELI